MFNNIRIGIDLDGVLRNLVGNVLQKVNEDYKTSFREKDVTMWDFDKELISKEVSDFNLYQFIHLNPTILNKCDVYRKFIKIYKKLRAMDDYDIIIITNQPINWRRRTIHWLIENYISFDGLIFTEEKHKWELDVIIDDKIETCLQCASNEILTFLWNQPWNNEFNKSKITDSTTFRNLYLSKEVDIIEMINELKKKL